VAARRAALPARHCVRGGQTGAWVRRPPRPRVRVGSPWASFLGDHSFQRFGGTRLDRINCSRRRTRHEGTGPSGRICGISRGAGGACGVGGTCRGPARRLRGTWSRPGGPSWPWESSPISFDWRTSPLFESQARTAMGTFRLTCLVSDSCGPDSVRESIGLETSDVESKPPAFATLAPRTTAPPANTVLSTARLSHRELMGHLLQQDPLEAGLNPVGRTSSRVVRPGVNEGARDPRHDR
jgi:hypothetical protein